MRIFSKILSIMLIVGMLLQASAFSVGNLWYFILISGGLFTICICVLSTNRIRVDVPMIILLLVCVFSLIVNDINAVFRPWQRFLGFILVLLAFSDLLPQMTEHRLYMFGFLKKALYIFIILSFIVGILGIQLNPGRRDFCGLANHSMMLAPLACISAILSFDDINNQSHTRLSWLCFLVSIASALLAASRIALGGLIIALLAYLYVNRQLSNYWKYLFWLIIIVTIIVVINPYGVTDNVISKMSGRDMTDLDSITSNRWSMTQDRIAEFKDSPIFGVGFAQMKNLKMSKIDVESGVIESGSSWIYLLSSMGIFGALAFILVLFRGLIRGYRCSNNYVFLAVTLFFVIHMSAEGYLFAFGSPLCALFWLFLGLCSAPQMQSPQNNMDMFEA